MQNSPHVQVAEFCFLGQLLPFIRGTIKLILTRRQSGTDSSARHSLIDSRNFPENTCHRRHKVFSSVSRGIAKLIGRESLSRLQTREFFQDQRAHGGTRIYSSRLEWVIFAPRPQERGCLRAVEDTFHRTSRYTR